MSLLIVAVVSVFGILFGKILFKKWINHLTSYSIIMGGLIFFYELKLLPYIAINSFAWFLFAVSFLAFLFGILTVTSARNLFDKEQVLIKKTNISFRIFADNGKAVKYSILFFSLLGLIAALQRWYILVKLFGSVPAVLINANAVYSIKVHKQELVKDFIPILPAFIYVAIFLAGLYAAYKRKFSFVVFIPFIVVVIKEFTDFGRAELLLTMLEFFFTFFLFRNLLKQDSAQRFKFSKGNAVFASTLLLALIIASASFIRISRGSFERYPGASKELNQLSQNMIISPSIYLYLSSDAGVFSKYLEAGGEDAHFGESTFYIGYVFLSYLGLMERPEFLQKGYYIPMWTNTGTYLRELHADFGVSGVLIVPYLIGLFITWLWIKFYQEKSLKIFALLVYFFMIIGFSFLTMVTKSNMWYISLVMIIIYLPLLEKFADSRKVRSHRENN